MRTTWIAISLCLALLGAAGCSSEEDREKAELRAQIEAKVVELEKLFVRQQSLKDELYPDWPQASNQVGSMAAHNLSADFSDLTPTQSRAVLLTTLQALEDDIWLRQERIAEWEAKLASREEGR